MLKGRHKNERGLIIESCGAKNVQNIGCGLQASYYIDKKGRLYSWGLNNWGQLGIGHNYNTSSPTLVKGIEDVVEVIGGEHHTVARTGDGSVYSWGKNDDGQVGQGDTYGPWQRENLAKRLEVEQQERIKLAEEQKKLHASETELASIVKEAEEAMQKELEAENNVDMTDPPKQEDPKDEEKKISENPTPDTLPIPSKPSPTKSTKSTKSVRKPKIIFTAEEAEKVKTLKAEIRQGKSKVKKITSTINNLGNEKEDVVGIMYFDKPIKIEGLTDIKSIDCGAQYSFAVSNDNRAYSWGLGSSYVLGTKEEDSEYTPFKVPEIMYCPRTGTTEDKKPINRNMLPVSVSCGCQHAVAQVIDAKLDENEKLIPETVCELELDDCVKVMPEWLE